MTRRAEVRERVKDAIRRGETNYSEIARQIGSSRQYVQIVVATMAERGELEVRRETTLHLRESTDA